MRQNSIGLSIKKIFGYASLLLPLNLWAQTGILSHFTLAASSNLYNGREYADVWGHVAGGREYAILTVRGTTGQGGVSFLDITNPNAPVEKGFVASPSGLWHDVKTFRNFAYIVGDQGTVGVQIVNMAGLPNSVQELTAFRGPTNAIQRSHNLWLDSTHTPPYLYIVQPTANPGVIIASINVTTGALTQVGQVNVEAHDMHANHSIHPDRLYVSTGYTRTLDTYNTANPAAPVRISRITFANYANTPPATNEPATTYSHNCWLSDDGRYLFTTQETAGTTVKAWDITNETAPTFAAKYIANVNGNTSIIAHNVHVFRKYLYVPHYTAGLRIVDISARPLPAILPELGYHRPSTQTGAYDGTWGSYQWYPSGVVIHGDGALGLQVLIPDATIIQPNVPVGVAGRLIQRDAFSIASDAGILRIRLPGSGNYHLSIFTHNGREVYNTRHNGEGLQSLNVDLSKGNYVAKLRQDAGLFSAPVSIGN